MGYNLKSAWELEFTLHDAKTGQPLWNHPDELSLLAMRPYEKLLYDISSDLAEININVEKLHVEWAPSTIEMTLVPTSDILSVDNMFIAKAAIKDICFNKGYIASFMPASFDGGFSTLHLNHSLWNDQSCNAFYDEGSTNSLSEVARYWVAGLLKHAPALTALFCPTVNCYRENLHTLFTADKADWGVDNRHAAMRIKNTNESQTYVENRIPSSAANPYIVLAATVAAGIDGIKNKLKLPETMDPQAPTLPHTLEEALDALEQDKALVDALGAQFVEWYQIAKRTIEVKRFGGHDLSKYIPEEIEIERQEYFLLI